MAQLNANNIQIEYETFGDPVRVPLLLIMGLGAQLTRWPEEFCEALATKGHYVIRFDNRDIGLSTHLDDAGTPDIAAITAAMAAGKPTGVAYDLTDMANDAVGVLDALQIDSAHICGASLGGMIAQTLTINHPTRVRTLTSIMSTTGNRELPPPAPEALAALMSPPVQDREGTIQRALEVSRVIGSPAYPTDEDELRARAGTDFDRSFYPVGTARQMAAITVQNDRRAELSKVTAPSLIIHGKADALVPLTGGIDTHEAIPGAELWAVDGMGHDLPKPLWPEIVERIAAHTAKAPAT